MKNVIVITRNIGFDDGDDVKFVMTNVEEDNLILGNDDIKEIYSVLDVNKKKIKKFLNNYINSLRAELNNSENKSDIPNHLKNFLNSPNEDFIILILNTLLDSGTPIEGVKIKSKHVLKNEIDTETSSEEIDLKNRFLHTVFKQDISNGIVVPTYTELVNWYKHKKIYKGAWQVCFEYRLHSLEDIIKAADEYYEIITNTKKSSAEKITKVLPLKIGLELIFVSCIESTNKLTTAKVPCVREGEVVYMINDKTPESIIWWLEKYLNKTLNHQVKYNNFVFTDKAVKLLSRSPEFRNIFKLIDLEKIIVDENDYNTQHKLLDNNNINNVDDKKNDVKNIFDDIIKKINGFKNTLPKNKDYLYKLPVNQRTLKFNNIVIIDIDKSQPNKLYKNSLGTPDFEKVLLRTDLYLIKDTIQKNFLEHAYMYQEKLNLKTDDIILVTKDVLSVIPDLSFNPFFLQPEHLTYIGKIESNKSLDELYEDSKLQDKKVSNSIHTNSDGSSAVKKVISRDRPFDVILYPAFAVPLVDGIIDNLGKVYKFDCKITKEIKSMITGFYKSVENEYYGLWKLNFLFSDDMVKKLKQTYGEDTIKFKEVDLVELIKQK